MPTKVRQYIDNWNSSAEILIVDDCCFEMKEVIEAFEQINENSINVAFDGQAAVEIVRNRLQAGKAFKLILLDLIMPKVPGGQTCELIREVENKYGVKKQKVVGYSMQGKYGEVICSLKDMNGHLQKPTQPEALQVIL